MEAFPASMSRKGSRTNRQTSMSTSMAWDLKRQMQKSTKYSMSGNQISTKTPKTKFLSCATLVRLLFSPIPHQEGAIVLKLVSNPREVLLNFDLDVCSMGWDGTELWLLPWAARALGSESALRDNLIICLTRHEAGYSVFTMNMIEGHYLGERRATQEKRRVLQNHPHLIFLILVRCQSIQVR